MQALKSLFSRAQAQVAATVSAQQPVELSPESLKLVGGGKLPRVGGETAVVYDTSSVLVQDAVMLPRVG